MFKILDGKKTLIGVIIGELPNVIESITKIINASGADATDWVRVSGAVLEAIGLIHKFLKGE